MSSEERKATIVDAACRLFAEKGFRGATTRELAAAVGVTEPVLYEHFSTKRDLYSAIIETKARAGFEYMNGLRDTFSAGANDREFFTALGERVVEWYTGDPDFVRLLLFSNLEGHELKDVFAERTRASFGPVVDYIARRAAEGAMCPEIDPEVAARAFFGMVAHYALTGLVFGYAPFPRSSKEVVAEMVRIFLSGMYKQESAQ